MTKPSTETPKISTPPATLDELIDRLDTKREQSLSANLTKAQEVLEFSLGIDFMAALKGQSATPWERKGHCSTMTFSWKGKIFQFLIEVKGDTDDQWFFSVTREDLAEPLMTMPMSVQKVQMNNVVDYIRYSFHRPSNAPSGLRTAVPPASSGSLR